MAKAGPENFRGKYGTPYLDVAKESGDLESRLQAAEANRDIKAILEIRMSANQKGDTLIAAECDEAIKRIEAADAN